MAARGRCGPVLGAALAWRDETAGDSLSRAHEAGLTEGGSGMPTRESRVVGDRYVLTEVIGRGGMAEVYRAEDRVLRRPVAVKMMRDASADARERARFAAEARTLARLSHPGLVPVLDAGTSEERPYLVMELVEGPNLADCCRGVAIEPSRVAAIGAELASALAYVHAARVVHRDVKPSNVLLDQSDRVRLTDFGIARLLSDTSGYTATGTTIGTAAYLAPEQVRGEPVGEAADVYSLGLVLLEALTGERAYQGSPTEAALARLSTPPRIPDSLAEQWQMLLRHMTSLEAPLRPTAEHVAGRLREMAGGADPVTATAVIRREAEATRVLTGPALPGAAGTSSGSGTWRGRDAWSRLSSRPVLAVVAGLVILLALAVGFLAWQRSTQPDGSSDIPSGTPSRLQEPLADLHDAVEGR